MSCPDRDACIHGTCDGCAPKPKPKPKPKVKRVLGAVAGAEAAEASRAEAILDKLELAAFRALAIVEHRTWCHANADGCTGCESIAPVVDMLEQLGRPLPKERLREQREATRG